MIELTTLWLPIVLATVAIFIYSSMAWMMLPHHRPDFTKLEKEDEVMDFVRGLTAEAPAVDMPGANATRYSGGLATRTL